MISTVVGQPCPFPVPNNEGAVLELTASGLVMIIQMPGITRQEKQAFKKSFRAVSYLQSGGAIPVAMLVFDFPAPFGKVNVNFNSRIVKQGLLDTLMEPENGQHKNALMIYLVDGKILQAQKLVGLPQEMMSQFHATIVLQQSMDYQSADYIAALNGLYMFDDDELFALGSEEYIAISSEINELESILSGIPQENVIERIGFETRLATAKAKLQQKHKI